MATSSSLPTSTIPPKNYSLDWIRSQLREQITSTFTEDEIKQLDLPPGDTETQAGKYKALEKLALDNVVTKEKALGPEHVDTLAAMHALGMLQSEIGEHAQAEETWRKILMIQEKDRPNTSLAVRSNLGFALVEQAKYAEAEEIARQLLPVLQGRHGKDSPQALGALRQLTEAVGAQRRYQEAKTLNEQGFKLVESMSEGKFKQYQQEELEAMQQVAAQLKQ